MQARAVASEGNEVPQAPLPCGRGSAKRTKYARISLIGLHSYDLITSMSCTRLLPRGGVPRKRDDRICQAICCPIPLDVCSEAFGIRHSRVRRFESVRRSERDANSLGGPSLLTERQDAIEEAFLYRL